MTKKVIIIGAGIAGLAACTRLIELGFDAIILEARDRCGGRIWSDNQLGIPFGRGASWIHGTHDNPIAILAQKFQAEMVAVDHSHFILFDRHGVPINNNDVQDFQMKFEMLVKKAKELALRLPNDISLATAFSQLLQFESYSDQEQDLFENKVKLLEGYMGAGLDSLSAVTWNDALEWPGKNCFLTTSYEPIIDGLMKNCSVQLNTIVSEIHLTESNVKVIANNTVFYADAVIVTLPLGVLKKNKVKFYPALSVKKQKSIESLGMGLFNITAAKFPEPFWNRKAHAMIFSQFDQFSSSVFFNLYHFIDQPILVAYDGGQAALQREKFTNEELIIKMMTNFEKHFCSKLPDPETYIITRWSQDPFSYGSYSYLQTGSSCADYETIAEPVSDKLFFAGEATCPKYPATTHGAYLSGIREAERINQIFQK